MDCYVAVQKSFLSCKNIAARILWARRNDRRLLHNGRTLCLQMNLVLLFVQFEIDYRYGGKVEHVCIRSVLCQHSKVSANLYQYGVAFLRVDARN